MNDFVLQMRPFFGGEERELLQKYMAEDGFLTEFKETEKFEKLLSEILVAKHCFCVNNGTVALTIAAIAAGVGPGDEVIVPNYTMIATPNSVKILGAKPVFCDVEFPSLCIDKVDVLSRITKRTKAVILMNANGRFPSYDVSAFCRELNNMGIMLIEDSAQSLGSYYPDKTSIGCKGNVGTLSFSAPKIISTGQGGLVFTNDSDLGAKIKKIKDFGRSSGGNDFHDTIGYNFKFTDLQAVIGIAQLKKLDERIRRRKAQTKLYEKLLSEIDDVELIPSDLEFNCPWFNEILVFNREQLALFLRKNGFGTRPMYAPINEQPAYGTDGYYPVSRKIGNCGLWLPSHMGVSDENIKTICTLIKTALTNR